MQVKPMLSLFVSAVFGFMPTLALAQDAGRPTFRVPDTVINKGEAFAFSLCGGNAVPAGAPIDVVGAQASGGINCANPGPDGVQGGCPPYKFRLADSRDQLQGGGASLNSFLPPGVFLEPNGLVHGTISSMGVLSKMSGVICVEDSCHSAPSCKQLELRPDSPDMGKLSSNRATLHEVADVSPASPPGASPSVAAPASPSAAVAPAAGAAAGGGHGLSGGALAAIIAVPVVVVGAVAVGAKAGQSGTTCVTAADLVAAGGGSIGYGGPDTACTAPFVECGRRTNIGFRVCADLTCSSASYFYNTSDGARFNCGTVALSGAFTFDTTFCNSSANRVVAYCQAH